MVFNGHFTCGRYLFSKLAVQTEYCTVGEYSHARAVCRGQVQPTYGARKSALQLFVIYSCFHYHCLSFIHVFISYQHPDLLITCSTWLHADLHELHGRHTGLQQLELAMQCISSPSQKISKRKEEIRLLAAKNIFQISGPIKPKVCYVHVLDHFSFDTSTGTGLERNSSEVLITLNSASCCPALMHS